MTAPTIKAIETHFANYRFRSRLEARWAVFFSALGLQWEYEPEGFVLADGTPYLPDFRVTSPQGMVTWYEVKPKGGAEGSKMEAFKESHRSDSSPIGCDPDPRNEDYRPLSFVTLEGDPWDVWETMRPCPRCGTFLDAGEIREWDGSLYAGCWPCDVDTPGGGYWPLEPGIVTPVHPHKGLVIVDPEDAIEYKERVEAACTRARSARFEHGERG